jgi:hypothetical protein
LTTERLLVYKPEIGQNFTKELVLVNSQEVQDGLKVFGPQIIVTFDAVI